MTLDPDLLQLGMGDQHGGDLVEQLDELAADLGTNRSELIRRGAQAVLDAEQLAKADRELQAAYRRTPADPALVQSARRRAAETGPAW